MTFNLKQIPFSRYGSYYAFSHFTHGEPEISENGLYLRSVHGDEAKLPLLKLELTENGHSVPFTEHATPYHLRLESKNGYADICIAEPNIIRIKSKGAELRLCIDKTANYHNSLSDGNGRYEVNACSHKLMLTPLKGLLRMDNISDSSAERYAAAIFTCNKDGLMECAIEEFSTSWKPRDYKESFERCRASVKAEFEHWLENTLSVPNEYADEREIAAYINWSCVVRPEGHISRDAMYMSKNWMANVWSWDHCFNAMALIKTNPRLAWDQFMFMFDKQKEDGALPDCINDRTAIWNFVKPPVHGWTLNWMMERSDFIGLPQLQEVYRPLCKWTEWWLNYRDYDNDGIPQYNHGFDSGWDNSTIFKDGGPVESPDLCAFLVAQMNTLSKVALKLGLAAESGVWAIRSNDLLNKMIDQFWKNDRFTALHSGSHEIIESQSLIVYLPIILGKQLPASVLSSLLSGLKEPGKFLTEYGFATECVGSPFYDPDGYWRGPIWAPSTLIIIDGLIRSGETQFAHALARRFCDMIQQSGMAENFDAMTGIGLRDPAYTWTSSVFLVLANEYL